MKLFVVLLAINKTIQDRYFSNVKGINHARNIIHFLISLWGKKMTQLRYNDQIIAKT